MNWNRLAEYWAGEVENAFQGTILYIWYIGKSSLIYGIIGILNWLLYLCPKKTKTCALHFLGDTLILCQS